jgi:hypothetical protein
MSEAVNFSIIFDGPALEGGEIDVNDLAPALMALNDLFRSANKKLNGNKVETSLRVRATAAKCFEVDLSLIQLAGQTIQDILTYAEENEKGLAAANELVDLLLKVVGGTVTTGGGLFGLLKWLRGRKPTEKTEQDGNVGLIVNGDVYFVDPRVVELAEDLTVRTHVQKLVKTLEQNGIDSISTRKNGNKEVFIQKGDIHYFELPVVEDSEDEKISDYEREMTLQVVSLSFKEDNKWRFTDGAEPFYAAIEDMDFLNQVDSNELSFAKADYLKCLVCETQIKTSKGLKLERTIKKVLEHQPSAKQLRLLI